MLCPECGSSMNEHAEKPSYADGEEIIFAIYCCPACGKVESQQIDGL